MEINESKISMMVDDITRKVKMEMKYGQPSMGGPMGGGSTGIYKTIDECVRNAGVAQKQLIELSFEKRAQLISAMRNIILQNADPLAKLAVDETRLGRYADKIKKNILAAKKAPGCEDLTTEARTGDDGLVLYEYGPYGVIGSVTPTTNPTSTITSNSIGMIAAGNSVVFNPHPRAKKVSLETMKLLNRAIISAGGPKNLICSVEEPSIKTSQKLMNHPGIRLLVVTGGEGVVKYGLTRGKKCIAAGPGNPPVFIDDTADIPQAAKNTVDGASFDNNILCIAEKEVFVFRTVADRLIAEMKKHGAYEIKGQQIKQAVKLLFKDSSGEHPLVDTEWVGQDAGKILRNIGITNAFDSRLVIAEVEHDHPFVLGEMLMPVLAIVRVDSLDEALEWGLRAEHGFRHTACMHSENVVNMTKVGRMIETSIFVKNAPSYAGLGMGGEGFCSLTIAGPTGEGVTRSRHFARVRRCTLKDSLRIV